MTLRVHLDNCWAENGPVRVLAGTHREGVLGVERIRELRQSLPEVVTAMGAGGVLLMRPLLLHASSAAESPCHRRVLHIEYAAEALPEPLKWHAES